VQVRGDFSLAVRLLNVRSGEQEHDSIPSMDVVAV
jgi:hypothetical protein